MGPESVTVEEIAKGLGISKRRVQRMAKEQKWQHKKEKSRGRRKRFVLDSLPPEIQKSFDLPVNPTVEGKGAICESPLQAESGLALIEAARAVLEPPLQLLSEAIVKENNGDGDSRALVAWSPERALGLYDLNNPHLAQKLAILREVDDVPRCWEKGRRAYVESVAVKHGISAATIYRWLERRERRDIAGLKHTKSNAGKAKIWTPEALEFWLGLRTKREHLGIDTKDLYHDVMVIEAHRRGWKIGCYESAVYWENKINPLLKAYSRGGMRALDNALPPILRDYSDLAPFEILVGDQHKFNRWIMDDETGEVFRPEGYLWQDLRTRIIYGAAIDKRYDSWLISLALRIGIRCYGAFGSIYTDNGKPECSRHLMKILAGMKALGLSWEKTDDMPIEIYGEETEEINPGVLIPGTHRKAIVKNAKAKMIEGTFGVLEEIMESHFRLPGRTKRLKDDIHFQEVDQKEAEKLAREGRLLLASEHALAMYRAADYYNREKHHRGVLREWTGTPKPPRSTPYNCLMACYAVGWRPRMISDEAADLIFLAQTDRVVNLGRIQFNGDGNFYEHEALIPMNKVRVDVRYNPMDLSELLVFHNGKFLCAAFPMERSSMKDMDLAERKIQEKRARAKRFSEEFKKITGNVPDFRQYSTVPEAERVAAIVGAEKKKRIEAQKEASRTWTAEELEAGVARMEAAEKEHIRYSLQPKRSRPLPERPSFFLTERDRHKWCLQYEIAGEKLSGDDAAWMAAYEAKLSGEEREYWQIAREMKVPI